MHEDFFYEKLGATLKRFRNKSGLTQSELAARVGMSRGSVSNIENGFQRLYPHQLYIFCKYLSTDEHKILPGDLFPDIDNEQFEEFKHLKIDINGAKNKVAKKELNERIYYVLSDVIGKAHDQNTGNNTERSKQIIKK